MWERRCRICGTILTSRAVYEDHLLAHCEEQRMPKTTITQDEHDKLADIIWWAKGYAAAKDWDSPFDGGHLEALRKTRIALRVAGLVKD